MNLREWNEKQIQESQSELNKYFFNLHFPNLEATDDRLLLFYIRHGGAYDFERRHIDEKNMC